MEYSFSFYLDLWFLLLELVAISNIPFCEKVVLDPEDFPESFDDGGFLFELKPGMGKDSLDKNVLDETQKDTDVNVFDMKRVLSPLSLYAC